MKRTLALSFALLVHSALGAARTGLDDILVGPGAQLTTAGLKVDATWEDKKDETLRLKSTETNPYEVNAFYENGHLEMDQKYYFLPKHEMYEERAIVLNFRDKKVENGGASVTVCERGQIKADQRTTGNCETVTRSLCAQVAQKFDVSVKKFSELSDTLNDCMDSHYYATAKGASQNLLKAYNAGKCPKLENAAKELMTVKETVEANAQQTTDMNQMITKKHFGNLPEDNLYKFGKQADTEGRFDQAARAAETCGYLYKWDPKGGVIPENLKKRQH